MKLTNEIIDNRLSNRFIKRNDHYSNIHTKIEFQCLIENCLYKWNASPNNVVNKGSGCPKCAGQAKISNDIIDERLNHRNIIRIGNYTNIKSKIEFKCLVDNCIWIASINDVVNSGKGCPKCAGNIKLSNTDIDFILANRFIKRLDNYINIDAKIHFQCLKENCNYIWHTTPYNIIRKIMGAQNIQ